MPQLPTLPRSPHTGTNDHPGGDAIRPGAPDWIGPRATDVRAYDGDVRYRREIDVDGDPTSVFAYIADFTNTAEWDPGIVEARRLSDGPTGVGSRFEVKALFRGREQLLEYVVTEYVQDRRITLHGEGDKAVSDDVITVTEADGRTRVAYEADLRLTGIYRVAEPFLRSTFERLGDDAVEGLAAALAR